MKRKICSNRAETLVEALCAVLITALATALLAGMVTSASRLNEAAVNNDDELYSSVTEAETFSGVSDTEREISVAVGGKVNTFTVDVFGDVVTSYKMRGG